MAFEKHMQFMHIFTYVIEDFLIYSESLKEQKRYGFVKCCDFQTGITKNQKYV